GGWAGGARAAAGPARRGRAHADPGGFARGAAADAGAPHAHRRAVRGGAGLQVRAAARPLRVGGGGWWHPRLLRVIVRAARVTFRSSAFRQKVSPVRRGRMPHAPANQGGLMNHDTPGAVPSDDFPFLGPAVSPRRSEGGAPLYDEGELPGPF